MTRKTYTAEYKTKLVLEAIREESRRRTRSTEYASELEAGVPEEHFERILPEGIKGGKTRRTKEGVSPGE